MYLVASSCLQAITRPHHEDVGHGAEGGQMLDRLMCGAILSQSDTVVGHHVDDTGMRQGGQSDGSSHVICTIKPGTKACHQEDPSRESCKLVAELVA